MATPRSDQLTSRIAALTEEATALQATDPALVARASAECRAGAERDFVDGTPRGKAMVRRLRDLTVDRPALGIAVARSLALGHIVEDLLEGRSVDGVTGIGVDGDVLPPSRSDRRRRRGILLLVLGGAVLLVGATAADSLSLFWVITWTALSFVLIFGGLRGVLHRE